MVKICPERLGKYMLRTDAHSLEKQLTLGSLLLKWPPVMGCGEAIAARAPSGWRLPGSGRRGEPAPPRAAPPRLRQLVNGRKRTVIAHLHMLLIVDLGIFYEYGFTKQMLFKKRGNIILWAMN